MAYIFYATLVVFLMTTAGEDEKALDFVFIDQHRDNDRILFHDVNRIGFTQD